jgi:2-methylcitrate dehydratase
MSAINRSLRSVATKNVRLQSRTIRAPTLALSAATARRSIPATTRLTAARFSTMSPLQSGAPAPAGKREYDPEIKDIASFVHNTPIDSPLAVSCVLLFLKPRMLGKAGNRIHETD